MLRGIEGYGASSRVHTTRLLSLSQDPPIAIVIVDAEDRVRVFLPQLDELISEGLVILDPGRGDPLRRPPRQPPSRPCERR